MNHYLNKQLAYYDQHFACTASVVFGSRWWKNQTSGLPDIWVALYRKAETGRAHDVLVTLGMSQVPQCFPADYHDEKWSTELLIYLEAVTERDIHWMLWLATLPYSNQMLLGYGDSIELPENMYEGSGLSTCLLMSPAIEMDNKLLENFDAAPYPVEPLWVVPVTEAESALKQQQGLAPIFHLFQQNQHPLVLNRQRLCYLAPIKPN